MTATKIELSKRDLMSRATLQVEIEIQSNWHYELRLRVAAWLIRLAGLVGGFGIQINPAVEGEIDLTDGTE